jgi:alkylation response protein AidB-like acyl-CoA dehydrogenase
MSPQPADLAIEYNAMDDDAFRNEIRSWIAENCPSDLRFPTYRLHHALTRRWYQKLAAKGWLAPSWPRAWGGMGLTPMKRVIMSEEFERHGCARYADQGVQMIGPLLLRFGSETQRAFFLPKVLTAEHIWAQGYSEPNSGSDLASLATEAVRDGDHWIINGQKIWATLADDANWMHMLARTEKTPKPQNGISIFLVPLTAKGVTVRPIKTLSMTDDFCEVFFENVQVPADHIVGDVNRGWFMAKALLGFERIFLGQAGQSSYALTRLAKVAQTVECWDDPTFMDRYGELLADLADHNSLYQTFVEKLRRGEELGPEVSMLKINQSELYKRVAQLAIDIAGPYGAIDDAVDVLGGVDAASLWLQSLPSTIYGGSSEIQRNILAKQVLHLPSA